jgi:predicted RNA-binding protein with EMAP domain
VQRSLKVTVVRVGVAVQELVVVEEGEEVREGQAVFVAVLQGPVAEPRVQVEGRRA